MRLRLAARARSLSALLRVPVVEHLDAVGGPSRRMFFTPPSSKKLLLEVPLHEAVNYSNHRLTTETS